MPRTFTLARLMLGITAFCILCGLAVNFPGEALECAAFGVFFGPTIVVWLVMLRRTRQPVTLSVIAMMGAWLGLLATVLLLLLVILIPLQFLISPRFFLSPPLAASILAATSIAGVMAGPAVGAYLLGRIVLRDEHRYDRQNCKR
jgi:hypothetical protein